MEAEWLRQVVKRHERQLLRYASSLVGPAQAADVVQEAFFRLCKQRREAVERCVGPWLYRVTKNCALDLLRRAPRVEPLAESSDLESPDSGPQIKLERRQTLSHLQLVIEDLPERDREVVLLKFSAGLSYRQIGKIMRLSESNVGFILHNAMKTIRSELARDQVKERQA